MGFAWIIAAYIVFLVSVSAYKSRSVKSQDDFMVAGRDVSMWKLVGTLVCSWIGSGSIIGAAGIAYLNGFSQLWFSAGAWAGITCVYFLAHRVRRIAEYTLPDLLEKRYNALARVLGSITVVIAYTTIVGYQFRGGSMVLDLVAGIPREQGIIISGIFIVLFTALGGMRSIISLDSFNGILITFGIVISVPLIYFGVGGMETITLNLPPEYFSVFGNNDIWWAIGLFFPTFFLLLGESSMYQKFFSAKDESTARKSVIWWVAGTIVVETAIMLFAVFSRSYFTDLGDPETIVFHAAKNGIEIGLPFWGGAILLCAAVAIILSTANSYLLTPSTNLARDIYQRFINPEVDPGKLVWVQRGIIVALGIMAYLLLTQFTTVIDMALTAYTMIGAGITPAVLAAFLWKRVTVQGGVASMIGGMGGTVIAKFVFNVPGDYIIYWAIIPSLVLLVVVSLLTPPSPEEKWKPFISED